MPTSFSTSTPRIYSFAVALASSARLFVVSQLARHPDLSCYSDPQKRAREWLSLHKDTFEAVPGPVGTEKRRRLTKYARRQLKTSQKAISGVSQRAEHWIGLGDIWIALTLAGGRPDEWVTEPDGQFDVAFKWRNRSYLLEYQRTAITSKQWASKWEKRKKWYTAQQWDVRPRVVLVDLTGQQAETIQAPAGTIHVHHPDELPRVIPK